MYPDIAITSTLHIQTYFLIISFGTILASLWFIKRAENRKLSRITAIDLTLTIMICGFIGARLFHVFYEQPSFYLKHPLVVVEFWRGGYVFFGGLLGAVLGTAVFCEFRREPFWFWADTAAIPVSLSYAIGRIGCFFNGCCYGKYCQLPWAVWMHGGLRHPTQLYASFWEFGTIAVLLKLDPKMKVSGRLFGIWLTLHAVGRIIMEHYRADFRGQFIAGQSISTWLSIVFVFTGLVIALRGTKVANLNR